MDFVDRKLERIGYKVYKETDDAIYYGLKCSKSNKSGVREYILAIDINDGWHSRCYITSWGNLVKDDAGFNGMAPVGIALSEIRLLYFKAQKMKFKRWFKGVLKKVVAPFKPKNRQELVNDHKSYEAKQKEIKHVSYTEKEN